MRVTACARDTEKCGEGAKVRDKQRLSTKEEKESMRTCTRVPRVQTSFVALSEVLI